MKEFKDTLAHILVMQLLVAAAVVEQLAGLKDEE